MADIIFDNRRSIFVGKFAIFSSGIQILSEHRWSLGLCGARRPGGLFLQKPVLRAAGFKRVKPGLPGPLGTLSEAKLPMTRSE